MRADDEACAPEHEGVSGPERGFGGDAGAVDARAVGALEVAQPALAIAHGELGVSPGDGGMLDADVARDAAADRDEDRIAGGQLVRPLEPSRVCQVSVRHARAGAAGSMAAYV